jgi:hypothetical protein
MEKDPNQKNKDTQKELEELKAAIEKIEKTQKKNGGSKKPRKPFIALELGGVFHNNPYVNFVFNYIVNLFFVYFVIVIFHFAEYNDIFYLAALVLLYTFIEEGFRTYLMMKHFSIVLKSFGTVFFFGYLVIFYFLDQYIFIHTFQFINATLLFFFVLFFALARYFFATYLRRYLRRKEMR